MTRTLLADLEEIYGSGLTALAVGRAIARHSAGDWGDLDEWDKGANDRALRDGSRIFSAYEIGNLLPEGAPFSPIRIWVITEAMDDDGVRRSTCVMLPSDY